MPANIYKSFFEDSCSVMLILDPGTGKILDANKAACKFYGHNKSQMLHMNINDINILTKEEIAQEMLSARMNKRNYFEFRHRLADGAVRQVEVFSGPVIINQQEVLYSVIHDVTERKRIERKIQESKKFADSLIGSLPGLMYLFDQQGHFIQWNLNFEKVSGYSSHEIGRMHPLDFICKKDRERIAQSIERVFAQASSVEVEACLQTKEGSIIPHLWTGLRFIQGHSLYLIGVGLDISERVTAEAENKRLITELQDALSSVKTLSGLIPICSSCKKIRDDQGYWSQLEHYIESHSNALFSHGLCDQCTQDLYGNEPWFKKLDVKPPKPDEG